jgi:hypothetical protein
VPTLVGDDNVFIDLIASNVLFAKFSPNKSRFSLTPPIEIFELEGTLSQDHPST